MYKILAFDGGGLRSVFQARLVERLEEALGTTLTPNLYAGTSGGAIVACGLQKVTAAQAVAFFVEEGPLIFKKENFLQEIDDLWNLEGAKYYNTQLRKSLLKVFGEMKLDELRTHTLITSFALKHQEQFWQPVVFHNFLGLKATPKLSVIDAVMRSAAAPTYFPIFQDHCDGGVWGNNPSMSAVAAAADIYVGRQNISDIVVLSIGTGRRPTQLRGGKRDLGAIDWFQKGIIDILMDGNVEASHYYTRSLLGPRYLRMQIDLDTDIKLDDPSGMAHMILYADKIDLKPILNWLEGFWVP